MEELIAPCGDNCSACPRYMTKSEKELRQAAELWQRLGWTATILSPEKARCNGCSIHHFKPMCSFGIIDCLKKHGISKCSQCLEFPCEKISKLLEDSKQTQERCRKECSKAEYLVLHRAFFCKETNLKR